MQPVVTADQIIQFAKDNGYTLRRGTYGRPGRTEMCASGVYARMCGHNPQTWTEYSVMVDAIQSSHVGRGLEAGFENFANDEETPEERQNMHDYFVRTFGEYYAIGQELRLLAQQNG